MSDNEGLKLVLLLSTVNPELCRHHTQAVAAAASAIAPILNVATISKLASQPSTGWNWQR